jgi:TonB family protein
VEPEEQVPFFSDRDTRAASTQPATGDAPVPSQQGRDLPGIDLVEQDFADGSGQQPAPNVSPQPRSASAQRALAQATPEQESLEPREEQEPNPAQEPTPESADRPVTDPRETPLEQVEDLPEPDQPLEETPDQPEPSPEPEPEPETDAPREVVEEPRENRDEEYEPENYEPDPELLALLEARSPEQPQAPEPLPAPEPAEDAEPRPEDPVTPREPQEERPNVRELLEAQRRRANPGSVSGFQEERTVTTLRGNISNRGDQNSVAAEKTPLGVYHKAISSAVSKVWQRYTRQSSHLFRIGTVKIRMKIYPSGRVSDIEVIDNTANESFATNTIRAINDAEIPPMPPEVRELMLDDPVKVEYTFSIY